MTRMAVPAPFTSADTPAVTVILRSAEELARLAGPWQRLAGAGAEPMQEHAWSLAAARSLHADARLRIVTVWRGTALAAVAPLVEMRRGGLRGARGPRRAFPRRALQTTGRRAGRALEAAAGTGGATPAAAAASHGP